MKMPNNQILQYITQIQEALNRVEWIITNHEASHNTIMARTYLQAQIRELEEEIMNGLSEEKDNVGE